MHWYLSNRADPVAVCIADRHYNRQKPGTPQFVPPGSNVVLHRHGAVWVTLLQKPEYTDHAWPGAWVNSTFRNETNERASDMIREAVAATRYVMGEPVAGLGMITFIDTKKVHPIKRRGVPVWGWVYRQAGFRELEKRTKAGLIVLQLLPEDMPEPDSPLFKQLGAGL